MADATGGSTRGGRRGQALRRYPALVWLIGAGLLALLLPSGLTLPQSGPSTLAEYAPVPGAGEGTSGLGELGATESASVGAGRGQGGRSEVADAERELPDRGGRLIRKPGTKRCVGDPPRQTEDPLSPPCVAFFEGDNFGATAKGVTADTVRVVVELERLSSDPKSGQLIDCATQVRADDAFFDVVCKALMKFFNDRYQTYGRVVHLWSNHRVSQNTFDERVKPFAYVRFGSPDTVAAGLGILAVGAVGTERRTYQNAAPFVASFRPDLEDQAAMAASFVCSRLARRPARYAGDPRLQTRERKFGYWMNNRGGPSVEERLTMTALKDQCGVDIEDIALGAEDGAAGARFQTAGVTTVLTNVQNVALATTQASNTGYFPEWVVPAGTQPTSLDTNFAARLARPEQWRNAFAVTVDYRRGALVDQPWYRAYRAGCPDCPEPQIGSSGARSAAMVYDALATFFYGVQAAGPRLTPQTVDKGMHAIPPRPSDDPFRPAAYFAPGNYSFIKDAMAMWWDPSGQAPGSPATGCYRLPQEGRRYRTGEWPAGDDLVKAMGPCQGDTFVG